ncbi:MULTISPECIES: hemerythrin domain-containing protein [Simplicispira]|jgi:hemerythrin-like domain-containing protein|uniref:Hemerythrin-like domain-containing protein n=1 Tax=Simplicispira metamorpha TaxID=80881 RepID=A0A4R2NDT5_9BURK|nr:MULTISPECIES: hemerythrin domain-containing protein [Simplicispira]MBP7412628.1 hemerythrin domain-containing protein [Giesbergeria sp.]MBP8205325.1 hemerythrin domain-containing protein [Giesbergeria sp.]MDD2692064.1 hemerythrin domain-containing protein [Simplicispira sp.]TCP19411.1 hemerythrin-like domain-containing protein [Simplicispira metamorpha]
MPSICLQKIRKEHASLSAVLRSLLLLLDKGPGDAPEAFFDSMRAMLFYIDEIPERLHHPKESRLLFPLVLQRAPEVAPVLAQLEQDHAGGEAAVRQLQHLLLAWELMGEPRRAPFANELARYVQFYMEHMRLEETQVLPLAQQHLDGDDWRELDAAFANNADPLCDSQPRDAAYDRLFSRIVLRAPSPIGLG